MNNQKNFGVWMDTHHATVVGNENPQDETFMVLAHVEAKLHRQIPKEMPITRSKI